MKFYQLKALLSRRGYIACRTRGSHTIWKHPGRLDPVILAGNNGCDVPRYQLRQAYRPRSVLFGKR